MCKQASLFNLPDMLSNIDGILLDMNSTFMFEEDNFDDQQDFYKTYLKLGGEKLNRNSVNNIIRDCYNGMAELYEDPAYFEAFPSLKEGFRMFSQKEKDLSEENLNLLTDVFAIHELGRIPVKYADFLTVLSERFSLVLVANIWAPKDRWLEEFKQTGITDLFKALVFSSDYKFVKPSPKIYQEALSYLSGKDINKIAFIGDSLIYDMYGASSLGLKTIWINEAAFEQNSQSENVDLIIPDLLHLQEA